jgi:NAD(P)-dependent dehydrogenase (short-subunit alcohol dehydrogenase family)
MGVNVKGVFLGTGIALSGMLRRGAGCVVNIASTSAIRGRRGLAAYVASKHAVLGLTRVAALDVAGAGVRVNAVLPGPVEGRMIRSLEQKAGGGIARSGPAPLAAPEDVADCVAFLASEEARHINGAALVVDGGATVM